MVGWCKLLEETQEKLKIAYSFEDDKSCDGILTFDKVTKKIEVQKPPQNKEWMRTLFICPLRCRIDRKGLTPNKLTMIMTG